MHYDTRSWLQICLPECQSFNSIMKDVLYYHIMHTSLSLLAILPYPLGTRTTNDRFSSQVIPNEPRIKFPPSSYSFATYVGISTYPVTTGYLFCCCWEALNFRGIPGYIRHCWIFFRQPLKMKMLLLPTHLRTYHHGQWVPIYWWRIWFSALIYTAK